MNRAKEKIKSFNDRDTLLFGSVKSEYIEFETLEEDFKPFYKLWLTCYRAEGDMHDWTFNNFLSLNGEDISKVIDSWLSDSYQLYKKLNEKFEGPAKVS
jgi:hypothetical protein